MFFPYLRSDNLIPDVTAACHYSDESVKYLYPSTSGHVPTSVFMWYKPDESFVAE